MARHNFGQMKAAADADGGGGSFQDAVVLPGGEYNVEIKAVKYGTSKQAGKDQVGVKFRVLDGPHAGQESWVNQTLTPDQPVSVSIFVRILTSLGVPSEAFSDGQDTEELVKYIVKGTKGVAKLTQSSGDRPFQNLSSFSAGAGLAAPSVAPSGFVPPVAPVAPPVAPVAAPVAPVAPPVVVGAVEPY